MSEELRREGWIKRTTVGEPRLSEIVELYRSLGYEVRVEPVRLERLDEDCKRCYGNEADEIKTVYVRKKGAE
jgi:signal recognition particle subunit SEC65